MKTKEPTDAMNHYTAELNAVMSLGDALRGDEIFRKHIAVLELYGPRMTTEERVQMGGGFYSRVGPVEK